MGVQADSRWEEKQNLVAGGVKSWNDESVSLGKSSLQSTETGPMFDPKASALTSARPAGQSRGANGSLRTRSKRAEGRKGLRQTWGKERLCPQRQDRSRMDTEVMKPMFLFLATWKQDTSRGRWRVRSRAEGDGNNAWGKRARIFFCNEFPVNLRSGLALCYLYYFFPLATLWNTNFTSRTTLG